MADLGSIVTDAEVSAIPGWSAGASSAWSTLEQFLVRGIESVVQNAINLQVSMAPIVQEAYTIEPPIRKDNVVTHPRDIFLLQHAPVITWTKLEIVSQRADDGTPSLLTTLPRNSYQVNMQTGILRLLYSIPLDPSVWPYPLALDPNNLWPFGGSFPPGVGNLLATYTAGIISAAIPFDLKLVVLAVLARIKKKFQNNDWDIASVSMQGSGASYLNVDFTAFEKRILSNYNRGYFPTYH